MLNEAVAELNIGNKIKVQDISELLLTSVDIPDAARKSQPHIPSLEQEDCHV
jgi:hypothetical protein